MLQFAADSAMKFGPIRGSRPAPALTNNRNGDATMATAKICSIDGCGKPAFCKGFCPLHYRRQAPPRRRSIALCSIDGCEKRIENSRGWCKAHYVRFLRHGDPLGGQHRLESLEWLKSHVGHTGNACIEWPFGTDNRGYGKVTHPFSRRAHRVMCYLTHGDPPADKPDAAHRCGNSICVNPNHLRWASISENMLDRVEHGTHNRGEAHPLSTLTECDVLAIREMQGKAPSSVVGAYLGVNPGTIQKIWRRERWSWL